MKLHVMSAMPVSATAERMIAVRAGGGTWLIMVDPPTLHTEVTP